MYNDGAFDHFTAKKTAADTQIEVEDGKPLLFGKEKDKGIRLDPKTLALEVVTVGQDGVTEDDILVHDEKNRIIAGLLARMSGPEFPVAIGVLYCDPAESYESGILGQVEAEESRHPGAQLNALLRDGNTWTIEG